jgi:hypothetical protein
VEEFLLAKEEARVRAPVSAPSICGIGVNSSIFGFQPKGTGAEPVSRSNIAGPMEKRCTKCGINKDINAFAFRYRAKNRRNSWCRDCMSPHQKAHYSANRSKYIRDAVGRNRELRASIRLRLNEYLESRPCSDCGETDPVALDFHHANGDKDFSISDAANFAESKLWMEVDKCVVLCANCHRKKHFKEKSGNYRRMGSAV